MGRRPEDHSARVTLGVDRNELTIEVRITPSDAVFVQSNAVNPFDNEPADINGHGVQLYLTTAEASGGWMIVPEADDTHGARSARLRVGFACACRRNLEADRRRIRHPDPGRTATTAAPRESTPNIHSCST